MRADHAAIERRIPDEFGYACAESMGVEAYCPLPPGADGKVFLVEGGLAMKITTSAVEAALCKVLADRGDTPGFFAVREVRSVTLEDGSAAYAILRDEISDVFEDPAPEEALDLMLWREAVHSFDGGWFLQDDRILAEAVAKSPPVARLDRVLEGLRRLKAETGATGMDLHDDNFGRRPDGHVCVRDLSRFNMATHTVEAILSLVEPVPERSMALGM